jgi:hypothetical protein
LIGIGRRPAGLEERGIDDRTKQKTALLPAPFWCTYRVESAHFDWRWRERPALALQAWEAVARDPLTRLYRIQVESIGTAIDFRSAAITNRDIASEAVGSIKLAEATIAAIAKSLGKSRRGIHRRKWLRSPTLLSGFNE